MTFLFSWLCWCCITLKWGLHLGLNLLGLLFHLCRCHLNFPTLDLMVPPTFFPLPLQLKWVSSPLLICQAFHHCFPPAVNRWHLCFCLIANIRCHLLCLSLTGSLSAAIGILQICILWHYMPSFLLPLQFKCVPSLDSSGILALHCCPLVVDLSHMCFCLIANL